VRDTWLTLEPWTIENGLITPTLKIKRAEIGERYAREIRELYAEHRVPA
jgi:long-chain acyl-CoA synthetase